MSEHRLLGAARQRLHPRVAGPLAALLLTLVGCGGPLTVAEPDLTADASAIETCSKVMAEMPQTVADQTRRATEPGRWSAAWGDPAIVAVCGASLPASAGPDAQCFEVNGVGWYAEETEQAWQFTTLGREVPVQVTIPPAYAPEADALVAMAQTINDHDPVIRPCI